MSYTIYWYRTKTIDQASFSSILNDFKRMLPELAKNGVQLAGPDGNGQPIINEFGASFNGKCETQGCCEAFIFVQEMIFAYREPRKRDGKYFQHAKTEGLPYELAVAAFLIIAKHYLQNHIVVSSDAPSSEWDKPKQWCQRILGYGAGFYIENDEE